MWPASPLRTHFLNIDIRSRLIPPCDGKGDLFYSFDAIDQRVAKKICRGCPVREACLRMAIKNDELYGVWGGKTARERSTGDIDLQTRQGRPRLDHVPLDAIATAPKVRVGKRTFQHGTDYGYQCGCRCPECKMAHRVYQYDLKDRRTSRPPRPFFP